MRHGRQSAGLQAILRARHLDIRVRLRAGGSDELAAAIRNGELDIAFLGLPEGERPSGVEAVVLDHDEHVLVVPADHRLVGVSQVTLQEIAEETFVDFAEGTPDRAQSDRAFADAGLVREVAYESDVAELISRLIARGLGIALLPSAFIRQLAAADPELAGKDRRRTSATKPQRAKTGAKECAHRGSTDPPGLHASAQRKPCVEQCVQTDGPDVAR